MSATTQLTISLATGGMISFVSSLLIVFTSRWHGAFSFDNTNGVQKMHAQPTPRIGGLPIVFGIIAAWWTAPPDLSHKLTPWMIAGIPAFAFGLAEDFTKRISVTQRLLATMTSGALGWWLTGYSLTRTDVWGLDQILFWTPASVLFTAFAVGGVSNAINIIDGLNGLASSMVFWALLGLAGVAYSVGDTTLAQASLIIAACVAGFFFVNWPFGKIFLGDGGSYFLGFALAWGCVILIERHQNVSAFSALLLCIHPVTEVLFSVYRRRARKAHPGHPDRLHLHSLFKRRVMSRLLPRQSKRIRNSLGGLIIGSMSMLPAIITQFTYTSTAASLMFVAILAAIYLRAYQRIVSSSVKH